MRVAWFVTSGVAPATSLTHIPVLSSLASSAAKRVNLEVFSFSNEGEGSSRTQEGYVLNTIPAAWNDTITKRAFHLLQRFLAAHRSLPFDVIHGFRALPCGVLAGVAARLARIPHVVTYLGGETAAVPAIGYGNMLSIRSRMLTLWTARHACGLHLLTAFQETGFPRRYQQMRNTRIFPFGVSRPVPRKMKKMNPPFHILQVGNLNPVKDQYTLLRAFLDIRKSVPALLRIVGPDLLNGAIQRYAHDLNIQHFVTFAGSVPHHKLEEHYLWADVYLQSSLFEGQGMSVIEAMAHGIPVCGTNVGILHDVPTGTALTVPTRSPNKLAQAAVTLLQNASLYRSLEGKAREWVSHNNLAITIDRLIGFYGSVLQ